MDNVNQSSKPRDECVCTTQSYNSILHSVLHLLVFLVSLLEQQACLCLLIHHSTCNDTSSTKEAAPDELANSSLGEFALP